MANKVEPQTIKRAIAINPSDTQNISIEGAEKPCDGVYIGGSGDLSVVDHYGNTTIFSGLAAGFNHPISATRINNTGTTATNIVAVFY